ncbi:hypothetical protein [Sphingobium sp. Z007]|uniref:hypothetical protein n=1 Tax=Sphingobium sp. Z007 TaxID=627495 RepID=UPI000B49A198|nr:hypothetical protein [Sphingobium sp. Z007]
MGFGKMARGLNKVGLALEATGYVWRGGAALWRLVRGRRSEEPSADRASGIDQADADSGQHSTADHDHLQR